MNIEWSAKDSKTTENQLNWALCVPHNLRAMMQKKWLSQV